ncbi:MAG: response regulator transcription factor [Bacteroidetes bacterium]|nr:response regulator transcription factor [Bacteroidota bacterium]
MIRILIADDHGIVRAGLKNILSFESDIEIVAEAACVDDAMDLVYRHKPDVLILDISMPGRSGLDAIPDIRRISPQTRILILTMYAEEMHALRCIKAGAAGYLTKDAVPEALVTAIRRLRAGKKYISPDLAEQLAFEVSSPSPAEPLALLSPREHEVLRQLALGHKPAAIADSLGLSPRTVGTYRRRVLEKLQLTSTAELIHFALTHNII